MTVEERITAVEELTRQQGARLERHSTRLEKLERTSESVEEIKTKVSSMETRMKKMEAHQSLTDKKLLAKSNATIALLCAVVALIFYIALKSPTTAKEVAEIVAKPLVQGAISV